MYYDAKFGRKRAVENGETVDRAVSNGGSLGIVSNGNPHAKRTSDRAIYEQFQSQVPCLVHHFFLVIWSLLLHISLICASSCVKFSVFQGQNPTHTNGFPPNNMDEKPYGCLFRCFVFLVFVIGTCSLKIVRRFYSAVRINQMKSERNSIAYLSCESSLGLDNKIASQPIIKKKISLLISYPFEVDELGN